MRVLSLTVVAGCIIASVIGKIAKIGSATKSQGIIGVDTKKASRVTQTRSSIPNAYIARMSRPVDVIGALVVSSEGKATLKIIGMFVVWYAFNAGYNVYNAFMKRDFQFPYSTATAQLFIGLLYAIPLWLSGLRKMPILNTDDLLQILPIAFLNALGHTSTVVATFEKGGGSFTHVIKAAEPVVSVLLGFLVNKVVPKPFTFLSMLPITYGVAYASTLGNLNPASMRKELTTKAAKLAMTSNFAFSMRSIVRKNLPADFKQRTRLDPANEFAVTTIMSLIIMIPVAFIFEGRSGIVSAYSALANKNLFLMNSFLAGMTFYLYNEMQNLVLGSLGPVPTAVGNTLKRVVIFGALYLFTAGETFPFPKVVGCAIAILGCLSFAICDSKQI